MSHKEEGLGRLFILDCVAIVIAVFGMLGYEFGLRFELRLGFGDPESECPDLLEPQLAKIRPDPNLLIFVILAELPTEQLSVRLKNSDRSALLGASFIHDPVKIHHHLGRTRSANALIRIQIFPPGSISRFKRKRSIRAGQFKARRRFRTRALSQGQEGLPG